MKKLALRIGISIDTFENITPTELGLLKDAYIEQQKHINYMLWVNGIYTVSSLQATVGNMFKKKGQEPNKYLEEPLPLFEERKELSEDEKLDEEKKLLLALQTMQMNFNLNNKESQEP